MIPILADALLAPARMHIPDGFLSAPVYLAAWALALIALGVALRRTQETLGERQVPLMGVLAAFIFAAQMLNFPVAGGTSGHLIGSALAAILMGPWAAMLIMTSVVTVQALIFQDGGLLVLGANILNMAVIAAIVSYGTYHLVRRLAGDRPWGTFVGGFVAAWLSVVVAAIATALELGISGTSALEVAVPAMAGVHLLIGIGEGLITLGALGFIRATRPDLLSAEPVGAGTGGRWWVAGLGLALLVVLLAPLASSFPDGLERVAEDYGFIEAARNAPYQIIPDYLFPGVSNQALATILAGLVGTLIVFAVTLGVVRGSTKAGGH
ncbi:MAG: cobalamin biosynthesis protein CbiM [Chloroflexi bacterium]|nr:MAG: cobalamin biosynthesis protein CbiM [Chloroflexota bacterium]